MIPFSLSLWPVYKSLFPNRSEEESIINDLSIDSRMINSISTLFVALDGSRKNGHSYVEDAFKNGAKYALVSKEWIKPSHIKEEDLIRAEDTLQALQDLAKTIRTIRGVNTTIIAIGGCTGKTMLKDLFRHILDENKKIYFSPGSYNSQIGVALSLIQLPEQCEIAFIEVAATKLFEMQKLISIVEPDHTIITNFARDRYGSHLFQESIKTQLIELVQKTKSWSLIEKEESIISRIGTTSGPLFFWNNPSEFFPSISFSSMQMGKIALTCTIPEKKESIPIEINSTHPFVIELIQIAITTCFILQKTFLIPLETVIKKLHSYSPQITRTEIWKNNFGTTYINSIYSQNAFSLFSSIEELFATFFIDTRLNSSIKKERAFILGDLHLFQLNKKQQHRLISTLAGLGISSLALWPYESLSSFDTEYARQKGITLFSCPSPQEAIKALGNHAQFDAIIFKGAQKIAFDWLFHELEDGIPQTYLCINLTAVRQNIDLIRKKVGPATRLMIMVKALAYGTDDVRLAHFLHCCGIDILGVSYVDEAVKMRKNGVEQQIFVLNVMEHEMHKACIWNVEVGIQSEIQIQAAQKAVELYRKRDPSYKLKIHLHVDTGMKRFGCHPTEALSLAKMVDNASEFLQFEGLFSHFCSSDDPNQDEYTLYQATTLYEIDEALRKAGIEPKYTHISNSAAAMRFTLPYCSMARIGIATYGIYPSTSIKNSFPSLRPALSLVTKISNIAYAIKNETVGYGRTYTVQSDTALIATIPIGYYDGIHRIYKQKCELLIRGYRVPIVGNICMDYLMADVTSIPSVAIGDSVLIFGEDEMGSTLPIEECASAAGSIAHELMTCIGPRVQRIFIYDESLRSR